MEVEKLSIRPSAGASGSSRYGVIPFKFLETCINKINKHILTKATSKRTAMNHHQGQVDEALKIIMFFLLGVFFLMISACLFFNGSNLLFKDQHPFISLVSLSIGLASLYYALRLKRD